mmetsp:Transcript_26810/g.30473  ORF Transcript_26810/g.30473 Transcript_26810/m.30473 type:complete len:136 (+) Transcript_26810:155-562(+)
MAIMNKKTLLVVAALFSTTNAFGTTKTNQTPLSSKPTTTTVVRHAAIETDPFSSNANSRRRKAAASSSPLPPAAHGILSPEIVSRMDENTANGRSNAAVDEFLQTYRRKGPMSCLEMLSDPEVLPHLTQAMRDIA